MAQQNSSMYFMDGGPPMTKRGDAEMAQQNSSICCVYGGRYSPSPFDVAEPCRGRYLCIPLFVSRARRTAQEALHPPETTTPERSGQCVGRAVPGTCNLK